MYVDPDNGFIGTLGPVLLALFIAYGIVEYFVYERKDQIATYLTLAERDLNSQLSSGLQHGGRKDKVSERNQWVSAYPPMIQLSGFGYKTAAEELIAENEKDLKAKGTAMGKASITAFLLRELYDGNVEAAQSKIYLETLNGEGKPPYIAPGIYELVEFNKFDTKTGFPLNSGVSRRLLKRVVRERQYPRNLQYIKEDPAGRRFRIVGWDVLTELTEQKI